MTTYEIQILIPNLCFYSIVRCIGNSRQRVIEGQLRSKELASYLDKLGTDRTVWLSEDATVIVPKVNYDAVSDTVVGLVLPIDEKTGFPLTLSHRARTADEIVENMKKKKANYVYMIMAQPLDERYPPFVLQLFCSSGCFTANDVTKRWTHTEAELKRYGVTIAGISSDGDPRLLSAMLDHLRKNKNHKICVSQDSIHLALKGRNRMINVKYLPMGTKQVSVDHLKKLLKVDKAIHGLSSTDVMPEDRQNFASFEKITSKRVLDALEMYVPNSEATVVYLQNFSDVVSSYTDFHLEPLERIERIWRPAYFFRIWREHILASKTNTLKNKFITSNTFSCIEINARTMLSFYRKCRDENKPHHFLTTLCHSQTCEKTFRQLRSMGSVNFTKINFSMLELLYMVRRIEVMNEILHFKLFDKGIIFPKFEVDKRRTKISDLPSEDEISKALHRAKIQAIEMGKKFGMSLDEKTLENYQLPSKNKKGVDASMDEINDESEIESEFELENECLDFEDESNDDTEKRFTEIITENGNRKIIRKSSLVWLLSERGSKISNDRLKRVQVRNEKANAPPTKRTRQNTTQ